MSEQNTKILVVEDDQANRKLFGSVLREKGYYVIEAADGEEAVDLIRKEAPSLVLLDVCLPKLSGPEVLNICREKDFLNGAKVYALTGTDSNSAFLREFDGVIKKPVRVLDFLNTVEKSLAGEDV